MAESLSSTEPATGKTLWMGRSGNADDEVSDARACWAPWAARPLTVRVETMRRFGNLARTRKEEFADLIARETGKPLWEAETEVDAVVNKVDISVGAYSERTAQRKREGALGDRVAVRHKPHGVLGVLGPYNFPAHLPNGHIVPALLAGNAVVFKPSEKTPAVGQYLVELYHEAGVPEGIVRLLLGGPEEGKALASHPDLDGLLFTGSAPTGHALHRQFAETPHKILALEMGGNNPLVVWEPADVPTAAVLVVQSAFLSAGQRCTAARRLIVQDGEHEGLIEEVLKIADRLIVDHPHATPAPFMGPVIDNQAANRLQEAFLDLMMKGGRVISHLDRPDDSLPFLTPAIIDVTDVAQRDDAELFGPILQVIRVPDFESAIAEANATRYGLSASLVGGSPKLYDQFWANVRAGVINWNKPTTGAPSNAPFGGVGHSGNHRPSAYYAADYVAYPVTSSEAEKARAVIGVGLADPTGEVTRKRPVAEPTGDPLAAQLAEQARRATEEATAAEEQRAKQEMAVEDASPVVEETSEGAVTAEANRAVDAARHAAEDARRAAEEARLAAEEAEQEARRAAAERAAEEARRAAGEAAAEEARRGAEEARRAAEEAAEEARRAAEERAAAEARLATEEAAAEEARRAAEQARLAAEEAAERARRAAGERAAEEARRSIEEEAAEEARRAADEARRTADEAAGEAWRATEEAAADLARRAAEEAATEEARRAADEARRAAEEAAGEARRATEEAAAAEARLAAQQTAAGEARRIAEEARRTAEQAAGEARRVAEEAAAAEARRAADTAAADARRAAEEAAAEEARRRASSVPRAPVVPMVDGKAERLADEEESKLGKR